MPTQVIYKMVIKLRNVSEDVLYIFYIEIRSTVLRYRIRVMENSDTFKSSCYSDEKDR
jgi:hypothetical protein